MSEDKKKVSMEEATGIDTEKPMSFEAHIEEEINKKNLNAPRVKKEDIDKLYEKVEFTFGRISDTEIICQGKLDGFTIARGFGACVDPKNFDEQIGMKIAHKKCALEAYDKLWELEGYRLSRSLNEGSKESKVIKPEKPSIIT
jgi:S-adenosylhomocysteine hydrolase